ncbi:hypothetical protein E4U09_002702 [Claviceps aff. purpurea]|uniref:4a-hydroxytetrahydrobiopterin dehydratase n=1 Tax=Claviceps aff. purpurea TaxID=1967640 RepID=A0A9P7TYH4_9HYPO|nr:hypothetical protein E4U09_002702 [Claviceps aff. purpurea]
MSVARIRAFARPALTKRFSSTMQPIFSPGTKESATTAALTPLLASSAGSGGKWTLTANGEALERSFTFKNFAKTWVYNTTFIRWTTHNPKGLSDKDVRLASLCDSIARDFGELDAESLSCEVRARADAAISKSGDCCKPKRT